MASTPKEPWFRDGLHFTCTQCGNCCTGAPGFVWVDDDEIDKLAATVGLSVEEFSALYVRQVGRRKSLNEFENGDCVFYRRGVGCTVYPARPKQCQTWPFWDSNLRTRSTWAEMTATCPGAGQGEFHSVEEIIAQSKRIKV